MNWISAPNHDINFKLFEFYKIKGANKSFSSLELKHMMYAHAKFGGPIALTSQPDAFIMGSESNTDVIKNICIFKNNGTLLHKIPKEKLNKEGKTSKIVGMDFIDEEFLVVITQTGFYYLIDPHKGIFKEKQLDVRFLTSEPIFQAKIFDNSVIFFSQTPSGFKFYFVRDIFDPRCEQLIHSEMKYLPAFFYPVSPKYSLSGKPECFVTNMSAGIHRLIAGQEEMILYNPAHANTNFLSGLPTIKEIKVIAMSPSTDLDNQRIAFVNRENRLYVVSSDFSRVIMNKEGVSKDLRDPERGWKRPVKLMFCGDAVVLFVSRTMHIITENAIIEKEIRNTKALLPSQELDGVRITSSFRTEILRVLPQYYVNIYKINSSAKAKDLYEAYEDYEKRQASYDNSILIEKKDLEQAVEDLILAACFELSADEQLKLLKAAHFGKTFLNPNQSTFDHDKFSNACKVLRTISSLRDEGDEDFEGLTRAITFDQFIQLTEAQVIRMLIRYQLHYLADEVCKYLNYSPKLASHVYVNWAVAKIESVKENDENQIPQQEALAVAIYEKLKDETSISFAEIARKAVEFGKNHLARKLLEKEKSFAKKLQVLLEMKDYLSSFREAIASRDPNLIEMVICTMQKDNLNQSDVWNLLCKTPLSKKLYLEYLKNFKPEVLGPFMETKLTKDERAFHAVQFAQTIKEIEQKSKIIQAHALVNFEDKFCKDIAHEEVVFLGHLLREKGLEAQEISINQLLEELIKEGKFDRADKLRKELRISDRNYYTIKARVFALERRWEDLEDLINDKNRKYPNIPWLSVVDMFIDGEEFDLAEKYIFKLPDIDDQISFLKMINRFKTAAEVAFKNKKIDALELLESLPTVDVDVKYYIDDMLRKLKAR